MVGSGGGSTRNSHVHVVENKMWARITRPGRRGITLPIACRTHGVIIAPARPCEFRPAKGRRLQLQIEELAAAMQEVKKQAEAGTKETKEAIRAERKRGGR